MAENLENGAEPAGEVVPGQMLPVPVQTVDVRPIDAPGEVMQPTRAQLAAPVIAAAGGFLVGVATFLFVRVLRHTSAPRRLTRLAPGRSHGRDVVASRSFLVDVHLLRR